MSQPFDTTYNCSVKGREIDKVFSFKDSSAYFNPAHKRYLQAKSMEKGLNEQYRNGRWPPEKQRQYLKLLMSGWDGRVSFGRRGVYPSGLVLAYKMLLGESIEMSPVELDSFSRSPAPLPIDLYGYQKSAVALCQLGKSFYKGTPGVLNKHKPTQGRVGKLSMQVGHVAGCGPLGLFILPVASGKTEIIAGIIHKHRKRAVVTAFNRTTMTNLYGRLKEYFPRNKVFLFHGSSARKIPKDADIVVSTLDTLCLRLPELGNRLWICDECHRNIKRQMLLASQYELPARFGLTATPPEGVADKVNMVGLFGPVRMRMTEGQSQELGNVAERRIYYVDNPAPSLLIDKYNGSGKGKGYDLNIVRNKQRNLIAVKIAKAVAQCGGTSLVLTRKRKHAVSVHERMKKANLRSVCVTGELALAQLNEAYDNLRSSKLDVIVGSPIVNTGLNIKNLSCTIALSGEYANTTRTQERGRSARKYDNAIKLHFDFLDKWSKRKGFEHWAHVHAKRRIKSAKDEGNVVNIISVGEIDKVVKTAISRNASRKLLKKGDDMAKQMYSIVMYKKYPDAPLSTGHGQCVSASRIDTVVEYMKKKECVGTPDEVKDKIAKALKGCHLVGKTKLLGKKTHILIYPLEIDSESSPKDGKLHSAFIYDKDEPNVEPLLSVHAKDYNDAAKKLGGAAELSRVKPIKQKDPKQGFKLFKVKDGKKKRMLKVWLETESSPKSEEKGKPAKAKEAPAKKEPKTVKKVKPTKKGKK